jgi:putative acetyltransferase
MPIEIAHVTEVHAEALRACLESVGREKKFLAHIDALPLERVVGLVRDSVTNNTAQYVALDGTAVVGWCDVIPASGEAVKHRGALGLGVLAVYRGRGLARRLMTAALEHAMRSGITRVELEVRADNWSAIELYKRMGFVQESTVRNGMRFDGKYFDVLVMASFREAA